MHLTSLQAHLICLALVAADFLARAWRIQWLLQGLGYRVTAADMFAVNAVGDAACAVTPLRIGGEAARLGGMMRTRVPATAAFVAISFEVLAAWPVILLLAGWLAWKSAPAWWSTVGPSLATTIREEWPWAALIVVASVVAWWVAHRWARMAARAYRPVRRIMVYWRRMPWWALLASAPMTLVNLVTRVAILPVLALTLPHPPALGPTTFGSFALLYSQLILPTPSGVGAVDLGFLGGAAGDLGGAEGRLLLAWRFYTSGVGVLLGMAFALRWYGWSAVTRWIGRRRGRTAGPSDGRTVGP